MSRPSSAPKDSRASGMRRRNVYLPDDVVAKAQTVAGSKGVSLSAVVTKLLTKWVEAHGK